MCFLPGFIMSCFPFLPKFIQTWSHPFFPSLFLQSIPLCPYFLSSFLHCSFPPVLTDWLFHLSDGSVVFSEAVIPGSVTIRITWEQFGHEYPPGALKWPVSFMLLRSCPLWQRRLRRCSSTNSRTSATTTRFRAATGKASIPPSERGTHTHRIGHSHTQLVVYHATAVY